MLDDMRFGKVEARGSKLLLFFAIYMVVARVIILPFLLTGMNITSNAVASMILQVLTMGIPTLAYFVVTKKSPWAVLPIKPLDFKTAVRVIIIAIATVSVVFFIWHVPHLFTNVQPSDNISRLDSMWMHLIAAVLFAGILEEVWFRGVVYHEYRSERVSIRRTAIASGLIFGLMHFDVVQSVYATVLGVLMAYLIYYTRSIWAPILWHVVVNALGILANPVFYVRDYTHLLDIAPTAAIVAGVASLVFVPIGVVCFKGIKDSSPREEETPSHELRVFTFGYVVMVVVLMVLHFIRFF